MATLSVTHTMTPGDFARASDVNQNYQDIVDWAAGNIQQDNIGTLSGTITWAITSDDLAQDITSTSAIGVVIIRQNNPLNSGQATFTIDDNSAVGAGNSLALDVQSTARGVRFSSMTEAQRDAIPSPPEGSLVYNSDKKEYDVYDGTNWERLAMPAGVILPYGGNTVPDGYLACTGGDVDAALYPKLATALGTGGSSVWGSVAAGRIAIPNLQRTGLFGDGGSGTSELGNSISDNGGDETVTLTAAQSGLPEHKHDNGTLKGGVHRHHMVQMGFGGSPSGTTTLSPTNYLLSANAYPGGPDARDYVLHGTNAEPTLGLTSSAGAEDVTGETANDGPDAASQSHNNLPPFTVVKFIIKT